MKKTFLGVLFAILFSVFLIVGINLNMAKGMEYDSLGTSVGGIIWENTTWTLENSPYIITDTVQIPSNVTLSIEPGVIVNKPTSGNMFLIHGTINAQGTTNNKIIFDGGDNSYFFGADESNENTFLNLDYCIIRNGISFWWDGPGHFNMTHSELSNLWDFAYIWYPDNDIHIKHNMFINTGGISIGTNGHTKVNICNNLFIGKNPNSRADYCIQNWASYHESETLVRHNSFIDMSEIVLKLKPSYSSTAMNATENY